MDKKPLNLKIAGSTCALAEALHTVEQRQGVYGPPREDMARIAALWTAYLGVPIKPEQVPGCQMLVKLSRLSNTPDHRDSYVDIAGYVHCYEDCINDQKNSANLSNPAG